MEYEYASKATAGTALGFGIGGAALALLKNGGLDGILGGDGSGKMVSRYEMNLVQENAILKAQADVDRKLVEVYNSVNSQINALNSKVDSNAAAQAVINCGFNSSIGILQTQVTGLLGMTKMVIPSTNICTASSGTATT